MDGYIIVPDDNVYFFDSTDSVGFVVLYDTVFKKDDGEIIHTRVYRDNDGIIKPAEPIGLSHQDIEQLCEHIRHEYNIVSLDFCYSCGRVLIMLAKQEIQFAPKVIQAILEKGYRLFMNDQSQLTISLEDVEGNYNQTTREKALLKTFKKWMEQSQEHWNILKNTISCEWRYAGRVKLPELKCLLIQEFPEENCDKNGFWSNFDWSSHSSTQTRVEQTENDDETDIDDGMCIVCYERERETFLEPCNHIVVCEQCSDEFAQNPNSNIRKKCILCRQSINNISYIKSNKIVNVNDQ